MNDSGSPFSQQLLGLHDQGLNWVGYASAEEGPKAANVSPHQGVLLFLSLGRAFAQHTDYDDAQQHDPFDSRARSLVTPVLEYCLRLWDPSAHLVYPQTGAPIDLRLWLTAARLQASSRLGIGIRPDCGTWFAVRAAIITHLPAPARSWLESRYPPLGRDDSPCARCTEAPCVSACPAGAVTTTLNLERCADERLSTQTKCASRCFARSACPVGSDHRYSESQMAYHYTVSRNMLRRWRNA